MEGSKGWIAPGLEPGKTYKLDEYFAYDVFVLGCFFYFVLIEGDHPFGISTDREGRMNLVSHEVYGTMWEPPLKEANEQAVFLLKQMIKFKPEDRYKLKQVLNSHYFLSENYYHLYDMPGGVRPGLCVIFNQEIFDDPRNNRRGTKHDERKLISVFKSLGFDVEIFRNLKACDLLYYIDYLSRRDFCEYASLTICILSHGDENVVHGTDFKTLNLDTIKYKFNSLACPSLDGKLKMFIIQACQGNKRQSFLRYDTQSLSGSNADNNSPSTMNSTESCPQIQRNYVQKIVFKEITITSTELVHSSDQENLNNEAASIMDILEIRASIPGYESYRSPSRGSSLIQTLCDELESEHLCEEASPNENPKDLEDILNRVTDQISKDENTWIRQWEIRQPDETKITAREYVKQTIVRNVSLNSRIKFKKARLPGLVTLRKNERELNNRTRSWRRLCFFSTPAHLYFRQSWDNEFDREIQFNSFFVTFLLWMMWSSFDFLSGIDYALVCFWTVLIRNVSLGLLAALWKHLFFVPTRFYYSNYWDLSECGHQFWLKTFYLLLFLRVKWSLFACFLPSVNCSFLNFLVFYHLI